MPSGANSKPFIRQPPLELEDDIGYLLKQVSWHRLQNEVLAPFAVDLEQVDGAQALIDHKICRGDPRDLANLDFGFP
jgi:hypothetical protein